MVYKPKFRKGRCYLRHDGKPVRIITEKDDLGPHYRCIQGDDGPSMARWEDDFDTLERLPDGTIHMEKMWLDGSTLGWRYDRAGDPGRCTGSKTGEPCNLIVGSNWTLRAMLYRVKCELKDLLAGWSDSMLHFYPI